MTIDKWDKQSRPLTLNKLRKHSPFSFAMLQKYILDYRWSKMETSLAFPTYFPCFDEMSCSSDEETVKRLNFALDAKKRHRRKFTARASLDQQEPLRSNSSGHSVVASSRQHGCVNRRGATQNRASENFIASSIKTTCYERTEQLETFFSGFQVFLHLHSFWLLSNPRYFFVPLITSNSAVALWLRGARPLWSIT